MQYNLCHVFAPGPQRPAASASATFVRNFSEDEDKKKVNHRFSYKGGGTLATDMPAVLRLVITMVAKKQT
eukprot:scaffold219143_cov32-Tisochrysis_lutea.AAC.1